MAQKKNVKTPDNASGTQEEPFFSDDSAEFNLDAFLAENDFAHDEQAYPDLNKTMSYAAVGSDYPEMPLVEDYTKPTDSGVPDKAATSRSKPAARSAQGSQGRSKSAQTAASQQAQPPARTSRRSVAPTPELQPTAPERSRSSRRGTPATQPLAATGADPAAFRQTSMHDTSYRVRGGDLKYRRTPIITILLALVVIAALAAAFYFLTNFVRAFVAEGPNEKVITLTTDETRSAIDSQMPTLTGWVSSSPDDAFDSFQETGWNVYINERFTSDNPDNTAYGKEIILLPAGETEATLTGYYEGGYNAYDFDELQSGFNGAWMLDLTSGDMGSFAQLKYVNLNSDGLVAEMQHLLSIQSLSGESTIVDQSDVDDYGNTFQKGYTVIDETTYYWEIIGIAFDDYYSGSDRRSLPDTAVFLKLKVATFDFYGVGADTTTAE
ncbi:MAG: hypothetical protein LBI64_01430 [Coriobacteriales bacterium]|jgi:hypothetical protein|nr:hypothetical protein [Coriobacteriales bacterium]